MGLRGKMVAAIEFKAGGDVFHELFTNKPHHVSTMSPDKIQGCELHEGDEFGKVGSVVRWTYTEGGKKKTAKQVIEAIDDEKKITVRRMLEGDLMEEYKEFVISLHVETKGDIDLVTYTLEYEMPNEDVGHPISFLSFLIDLTKDLEAHHAGNP
ncbi:MLP-like protein 43 [Sesamum alatum]|uniref:MLP-like protein 43 n=1 Tax=Sesamum alatum TaxID=300844 RepID=A0AAE1XQ05_9LAMI|nr:MLP-like protein 43 [Sesamum alatum]